MKGIVLLDPYVSHEYVYRICKTSGFFTIVFIINKDHTHFNTIASYQYDHFEVTKDDVHFITESLNKIIAEKNIEILYVLNGTDDSSVLAETLNAIFVPALKNGPAALLRTKKFEAIERLKNLSLSKQKQLIMTPTNFDAALLKLKKFTFPVIAKPNLFGTGKEGVHIFYDQSEITPHLLRNTHGHSQAKFEQYAIQELMRGEEFCIDTISYLGHHEITGVFKYQFAKMRQTHIEVLGSETVSKDTKIYSLVSEKTKKFLDAFEVRNGLNHTELMLLPSEEVELIEINPRLSGAHGALQTMSLLTGFVDQYTGFFHYLSHEALPVIEKQFSHARLFLIYGYHFTETEFNQYMENTCSAYKAVAYSAVDVGKSKTNRTFHEVRKLIIVADNNLQNISNDAEILMLLDHPNSS